MPTSDPATATVSPFAPTSAPVGAADSAPSPAAGLPKGWMRPSLGLGVRALMSARAGGRSASPYDGCNLGDHVGDDPAHVAQHRAQFGELMGAPPVWLTQVHGARVVRVAPHDARPDAAPWQADGAWTTEPGVACVVMVADCLPVLVAAPEGRAVAALHAGWRGLAGAGEMGGRGIVHTGLAAVCEAASCDPADLRVWLGPCIGPQAFEVGGDVLQAFGLDPALAQSAAGAARPPRAGEDELPGLFQPTPHALDRWWADLPGLARRCLQRQGVRCIEGGPWCTVTDSARFFSFRRDGVTGRQAAGIAIDRR